MNAVKPRRRAYEAEQSVGADCCDVGAMANFAASTTGPKPVDIDSVIVADPQAFVRIHDDGLAHLDLFVEELHCAACIGKIEGRVLAFPGVVSARINMSTRRLGIVWREGEADPVMLVRAVVALGYPLTPFDPSLIESAISSEDKSLLSAMAVAGFAAANVMLLSVAVWSGHAGDMGEGTRTLFHWISALISLPAVVYAGQPFFKSAFRALQHSSLNMDVPISLAVILASTMSLYQTVQGGQHAYFDAAITLLFFLLVGRYLDHRARARARSAATHLLALQASAATVIDADGHQRSVRIRDVHEGMVILVAAGERVPVDGLAIDGISDIDAQLLSGETLPRLAEPGARVYAGTLNLTAPIRVRTTVAADNTLLAEIVRLMELAEQGRARYVRLADRVAKIYSPVVHVLAAATFVGWVLIADLGWQEAMMISIAVLIITCPCALALAVPVVQVVASGRLLRAGILVKSADALERLNGIDTVVFDKTGTLTLGKLRLVGDNYNADTLALAGAVARHSRHPLSKAVAAATPEDSAITISAIREVPGCGLEGYRDGARIRLGSRSWCGGNSQDAGDGPEICLAVDGEICATFEFLDELRSDAGDVIRTLKSMGIDVELLSGDTASVTGRVAGSLGIEKWQAACLPAAKVARLEELDQAGHRVLMVGDGMNDAPSLATAFVSMSPVTAADVSQTAADIIFQGAALSPVITALKVARASTRLVKQNFALAFLYNAIAVPLAVAGMATPLLAAVAMSSSSILVTVNALRLRILR
ncbi:MAG: heavy metal translocating P-type ATPase [Rhodospirillales bacterium]